MQQQLQIAFKRCSEMMLIWRALDYVYFSAFFAFFHLYELFSHSRTILRLFSRYCSIRLLLLLLLFVLLFLLLLLSTCISYLISIRFQCDWKQSHARSLTLLASRFVFVFVLFFIFSNAVSTNQLIL